MRYFEAIDEQLVVRASARDLLVRGALGVFVAPWIVAIVGWGAFALVVPEPGALSLVIAWAVVAIGIAIPAILGVWAMATANRRARAQRTVIDVGERVITRPGATPAVLRAPDAVRVRRALGGWSLHLSGEAPITLLKRVPHGSGKALAEAADALADALGVEARVPRSARRAFGLVPHDDDLWAALCYAPVDGVNVAYSMLALMSSTHPRLRFAAKQSLLLLAVEGFLALCLSGCLGVPLVIASAPLALEAGAFLCPFLILAVLRVSIRLVAAVRARREEIWVMPWLAPIAGRWVAN